MISEVQKLLDDYVRWLKDKTKLRQIDDWVEITTPYLDRHNDYLQVYAKRENGNFLMTDDSYIIEDLKLSGCKLDSKKRKDLLQMIVNGFGVQLDENALIIHATKENFAIRKHNLIQAMLSINDLFCLSEPVVESIFLEDVTEWLNLHKVRYIQNVKFTGATGYDYVFHFVIPKSQKQPERLLRAINHPSPENTKSLILGWFDTRKVRPPESRAYAILNDSEKELASDVSDALKIYDIRPIPWSKRKDFQEELMN